MCDGKEQGISSRRDEPFQAFQETIRIDPSLKNSREPSCHDTASNSHHTATAVQALWEAYRSFVRRHRFFLDLADDGLDRFLFWIPHDVREDCSQWREVAYGLMSLHRLATDVACQERIGSSYGATVSVTPNLLPATAMRMALAITHAIMPMVLELSRSNPKQQSRLRLVLERVKCMLRFILLGNYWFQLQKGGNLENAGLLCNGGIYSPGEMEAPTLADVERQQVRREYVGRRTGRRVVNEKVSLVPTESLSRFQTILPIIVGEVLYIYRPLHWAHAENRGPPSPRDWVTTLAFDILSLTCLSKTVSSDNLLTCKELNRRKLKLLLYVLRSPIWEQYTQPYSSRVSNGLARVPLMGRLLSNYLMDFLLYCKHPYVSEEG